MPAQVTPPCRTAQRRRDRLARLPWFIRRLVNDRKALRQYFAIAPLIRAVIAAGFEPTPGFGLAQHDAALSIYRNIAGEIELSAAEFELALRIMTPPEAMQ
jgi:hypothetical protein